MKEIESMRATGELAHLSLRHSNDSKNNVQSAIQTNKMGSQDNIDLPKEPKADSAMLNHQHG